MRKLFMFKLFRAVRYDGDSFAFHRSIRNAGRRGDLFVVGPFGLMVITGR